MKVNVFGDTRPNVVGWFDRITAEVPGNMGLKVQCERSGDERLVRSAVFGRGDRADDRCVSFTFSDDAGKAVIRVLDPAESEHVPWISEDELTLDGNGIPTDGSSMCISGVFGKVFPIYSDMFDRLFFVDEVSRDYVKDECDVDVMEEIFADWDLPDSGDLIDDDEVKQVDKYGNDIGSFFSMTVDDAKEAGLLH